MLKKRGEACLKRQALFLEHFPKVGTIYGTCKRIGVSRETVRKWRKEDPNFEQQFVDCELDITDTLENKAMSQALGGDGSLLMFLLKARRPHMFREHSNITVDGIQPLHVILTDETGSSDAAKPSPDA